jgi:hypothetical protein
MAYLKEGAILTRPSHTALEIVPLMMAKPEKITQAGVFLIIGGVLALMTSGTVMIVTTCLWIPWIYGFVAGIMALVHGILLINRNQPWQGAARASAIMLIINIITCDILGMVMGILALTSLADPQAQAWLAGQPQAWQAAPVTQAQGSHIVDAAPRPAAAAQPAPADTWSDVQGGWNDDALQDAGKPAPEEVQSGWSSQDWGKKKP